MSLKADRRPLNTDGQRRRSALRRWLFPEWHPWFRDWADVLRLSFLLAVPPLLILDPPEALRLFFTFLVSLVPRLTSTPAAFDLGFNAAWSLQAWGNVTHVFESWLGYHNIVHFTLTGATAALLYFVFQRLRLLPDFAQEHNVHQRLGVLALTAALGTTVNAIYEVYEYFAIKFLHLHLLEYYQHDINDLFFGTAGAITAGLLLVLWSRRRPVARRPANGDPLPGLFWRLERRMVPGKRAALTRQAGPSRVALPAKSALRLLAGDWSSLIRDPMDLVRLSFLVGSCLSAAQGNTELAVRFGFTFLAALAVRAIKAPRPFDLIFALAMAFQAWGSYAGAYSKVPGYGLWVDFDVALAFALLLYLALVRFRLFPEFADEPGLHRRITIFLAAMCLGMSSGIYYELYLWFANHFLEAHYGASWGRLTYKTALDWAGGGAAGLVLVLWDLYGWGTRRRLPARSLRTSPARA